MLRNRTGGPVVTCYEGHSGSQGQPCCHDSDRHCCQNPASYIAVAARSNLMVAFPAPCAQVKPRTHLRTAPPLAPIPRAVLPALSMSCWRKAHRTRVVPQRRTRTGRRRTRRRSGYTGPSRATRRRCCCLRVGWPTASFWCVASWPGLIMP